MCEVEDRVVSNQGWCVHDSSDAVVQRRHSYCTMAYFALTTRSQKMTLKAKFEENNKIK